MKSVLVKMGLPVHFHRQACAAKMIQTCSFQPSYCSDGEKEVDEVDENWEAKASTEVETIQTSN